MLTEVTIRGFKAIKQATVTLEPLSLLIGRNGSGKSSLLECLQWLQEAIFRGLDEATSRRFYEFSDLLNRRSKEIGLELWLKRPRSAEVHYSLRVGPSSAASGARARPIVTGEECIVGRTSKVLYSQKYLRGPPFRRLRNPRQGHGRPLLIREGDTLGLAHASTVRAPGAVDLEELLRRAVFLRLSPESLARQSRAHGRSSGPILAEDGSDLPTLVDQLSSQARRRLASHVAAIIDGVQSVEVARRANVQWISLRERMKARGGSKDFDLPAWMLSEGTRRLVAIFTLLELDPPPSLIAIEEVENGLDPWTLQIVLDALRDAAARGTQIILTTHSPFLLDHVEPGQVIHVQRARGDTTYKRATSFEEIAKYEGVLAPGAMYLSKLFEPKR